jgi:hypothetical protein
MLKIVDPKDHSLNDKKHKLEFSKLIELGERAKNSMKQQVSQIVLLNCISEQVTAFLKYDLAFSIEEQARKVLGITSLSVGSKEKETDPKAKKDKKDKDLNYNRDFETFSKAIEKIHETAGVKSSNTVIAPLVVSKTNLVVSPADKKKAAFVEEEYFNNPSLFLQICA